MNPRIELFKLLRAGFQPATEEKVWEWAEKNIVLSARVTPNPGPYRTTNCQYVRAPQEDFTNPTVHTIIMCWAARVSKTETATNCIRYVIGKDPMAAMIAMPTQNLARSFSETRLGPSIDDSPVLAAEKPKDPDQYKLLEKHFKRMSLFMVGANSPATLKGRGVTVIYGDEIDTWPSANKKETGALEQLLERSKDRWNRKTILSSTPTVESGQIWKEFKRGDQRYFFVPCPHCQEKQVLKRTQLGWDEEAKDSDGVWDLARVRASTYYTCIHCEGKIYDRHKPDMLDMAKGAEWRATCSTGEPGRRSYHMSALYPDWVSFADVACAFLKSKDSPEDLQLFVNSWLAEPFSNFGDTVEQEQRILSMRGQSSNDFVPEGYKAIMSVDVQVDRLYYVTRGHDKDCNSIQLDYGCVPGFEEILAAAKKFDVVVGVVDARFRPQIILEWCAKNPGWFPAMGAAGLLSSMRWVMMPIDGGIMKGKTVRSIRFRPDDYKEMIHERLNRDKNPKAPKWDLVPAPSKDLIKQLAGEVRVERKGPRGRKIIEWIRKGPNHYWDCEVMQVAAWDAIRPFIFDLLQQLGGPPSMPAPASKVLERMPEQLGPDVLWSGEQLSWS